VPEVVEHDPDARVPQLPEHVDGQREIPGGGALGDLHHEMFGPQVGFTERLQQLHRQSEAGRPARSTWTSRSNISTPSRRV
jgi:hypothetical protein